MADPDSVATVAAGVSATNHNSSSSSSSGGGGGGAVTSTNSGVVVVGRKRSLPVAAAAGANTVVVASTSATTQQQGQGQQVKSSKRVKQHVKEKEKQRRSTSRKGHKKSGSRSQSGGDKEKKQREKTQVLPTSSSSPSTRARHHHNSGATSTTSTVQPLPTLHTKPQPTLAPSPTRRATRQHTTHVGFQVEVVPTSTEKATTTRSNATVAATETATTNSNKNANNSNKTTSSSHNKTTNNSNNKTTTSSNKTTKKRPTTATTTTTTETTAAATSSTSSSRKRNSGRKRPFSLSPSASEKEGVVVASRRSLGTSVGGEEGDSEEEEGGGGAGGRQSRGGSRRRRRRRRESKSNSGGSVTRRRQQKEEEDRQEQEQEDREEQPERQLPVRTVRESRVNRISCRSKSHTGRRSITKHPTITTAGTTTSSTSCLTSPTPPAPPAPAVVISTARLNRTFPGDNSSASASVATTSRHQYPLRSQGRLVSPAGSGGGGGTVTRTTLGATSSSQQAAVGAAAAAAAVTSGGGEAGGGGGQQQPPPRLTRTGAVLRRSTRNSKGHSTTTGSCASSSGGGRGCGGGAAGGSGGGGSGGRAGRQHKVGAAVQQQQQASAAAAAAAHTTGGLQQQSGQGSLQQPATPAMADQQPDMLNNGLQGSEEPPSPQEGTQAMASGGGPSGPGGGGGADSESDDSEVGRLQALLEARGLPPHLFGALGPRMHHLLHRSMGANSSATKAQQLLQGLQSTGDEGQQLQAVIEMCQMLVMGNEDTLTGFPVKQVVPALITLLRMEHNFDIMNHACRALTYMMEALPRSSAVVVEAVPVFLEKLQVIQCMDVAEQSLTALDMLSRRHSKAILQARGVAACLMFLDFFSINAQRAALSVTANCCLNLTSDEFQYVTDSLTLLANRLGQQDKKSVECVCLAFSRLVDSYQLEPIRLQEIASAELLQSLQQLLVVTPPVVSTGTFITVLRMLSVMCANCPDLALMLLRQDIAETLLYLLTGSNSEEKVTVGGGGNDVELVARQPQELYEITALIGELMPKLPTDGIFAVDSLLERPTSIGKDQPTWQWRDDRGLWHPYGAVDSRMIEAAHLNSDDEVSLNTLGRTYTIDFHSMQQINEDSGTTRPVQRRYTPQVSQVPGGGGSDAGGAGQQSTSRPNSATRDARVACLREERGLAASFIRSLFSVLYEVYSSSAGPTVRCKCLKALLRMVYYATPELLREVLKNQVVSSHIAGMMASSDLRIVVGALQMAEILMTKLPEVFGVHFRREGVMHQIHQLADPEVPLGVSPPKSAHVSPYPMTTESAMAMATSLGQQVGTPSQLMMTNNSGGLPLTANGIATMKVTGTPSTNSSIYTSTPDTTTTTTPRSSLLAPTSLSSTPVTTGGLLLLSADLTANTDSPTTDSPSSTATTTTSTGRSPSPHTRFTDVLKRKRVGKRGSGGGGGSGSSGGRSKTRHGGGTAATGTGGQEELPMSPSLIIHDLFNKATSLGGAVGGGTVASNSNSSRPRYSGGSSKTSSFLQSLNPARWGRNMNSSSHDRSFSKDMNSYLGKSASNSNLTAGNREKTRTWVRDQSSKFIDVWSGNELPGTQHPAMNVLSRLTSSIQKLPTSECGDALRELREILIESDISPFEVNHSGLIKALLAYLANLSGPIDREQRLRIFLHVFAACPLYSNSAELPNLNPGWFGALVAKLGGCVSQLEQFPVKVHDLPANSGAGRGGTSALKFFNTHQLKCNLQRHPDCSNLKQWKGGTVKIDPLALVQAIERYLVVRGYGRLRDSNKDTSGSSSTTSGGATSAGGAGSATSATSCGQDQQRMAAAAADSDEADSDDDIDDTLAAVAISQSGSKHKLQFLIGGTVLPYNMTVYQAVRQFSNNGNDQSETDTDNETPLGHAGVWVQTHTIYYRPLKEETPLSNKASTSSTASHSSRKGKGSSSKNTSRRKADELWNEGITPPIQSPLSPFLTNSLPDTVTIQDASLDVLCLLRILHSLNKYWTVLYPALEHPPILPPADFLNSKIAAKATRQLQDPLVIMTGNLPNWLQQIATVCPFLFPFETRQLLFYATSFDRDRALQRLLDMTPELSSTDSQERVTPRLDRRKRTISRDDILKQAEQVMQDLASSKALLEVHYENEVGTGLGPTLEFYALVSRELQKADLDLWHNSGVTASTIESLDGSNAADYVHSVGGLFPAPLSRNAKVGQITRVKTKFRFLGKFMAKAVMDSRMLDLPFSLTFYRWLLGQEHSLNTSDVAHVAPEVYKSLRKMQHIVRQRDDILNNADLSTADKNMMIDKLQFDGCPIPDLTLDFLLPTHHHLELCRSGRSTPVTIHNLHQYVHLVRHWLLVEGVARQMDSLREGFESVFPLAQLRMFSPEELEAVFCGCSGGGGVGGQGGWDVRMLVECCRPDHGYTVESTAIRWLFEVLSGYGMDERRQFVQFLTGSPRLPVGGFKALSPPLTVVRRTLDPNMNPDDFLPSVMTCVNYLKLPDYSTLQIMRDKLRLAASEGQHSFYLS